MTKLTEAVASNKKKVQDVQGVTYIPMLPIQQASRLLLHFQGGDLSADSQIYT